MKHLMKIFLFITLFTNYSSLVRGQTWVEQNSGVTVTLTSVSSFDLNINNQTVWVCGYNGTVLRSTNYGSNWINVSGNGIPTTVLLISIASIDQSNAITAGYIGANTFVYKTTNAGANWTQVFTETGGFIDAICIDRFNINKGFMMGDPVGGRWSLWRTTDRGTTWDSSGLYLPQAGTEASWNNAMFCIGDNIWFGTNNTRIYYSSNYGTNWITQTTTGEVNSYAVHFNLSNSSEGFIGGASLLRTSNSGTNWTVQTSSGAGNFGGITSGTVTVLGQNPSTFINTWYVRSNNIIYYSPNNGTNWISQYTAPAGNYRYISSNSGTVGFGTKIFAVRNNGGISFLDVPVGITQLNTEAPVEYSLSQNYPNPFNPSTKINFAIPKSSEVSLRVYDVLGKEVATLINEFKTAGNYSFEFNQTSNMYSGIYFYTLNAGDFTDTKKLMLVK